MSEARALLYQLYAVGSTLALYTALYLLAPLTPFLAVPSAVAVLFSEVVAPTDATATDRDLLHDYELPVRRSGRNDD